MIPRVITDQAEFDSLPVGSIVAVEHRPLGVGAWTIDAAVRTPQGAWFATDHRNNTGTLLMRGWFTLPNLIFRLVYAPEATE